MKIKSSPPNLKNLASKVASSVANSAASATSASVWDSFRQAGLGTGVSYQSSGGFGASFTAPASTQALQQVKRTAPKAPSYLPNLEESLNGKSKTQSGKNTAYVDDDGWPVTLAQIVGSRMLTPDQLQKASIQNVSKLVQTAGGTPQQREELKFMFQRMMLEGFTRGVDITKELSKQGGLKISIDDMISGKSSVIGVAKKNTVQFGGKWWNSKSEADRYTLFLHEVGHNLLNAHHANENKSKDDSVMTPIYNGSILKNYNQMLGGLFKENGASWNKVGTNKNIDPQYKAEWFPSLSGEDYKSTPEKASPAESSTGAAVNNYTPITNNVDTTTISIQPNTKAAAPQQAQEQSLSPQQSLPETVNPFSQGLANLSAPSEIQGGAA